MVRWPLSLDAPAIAAAAAGGTMPTPQSLEATPAKLTRLHREWTENAAR